MADSELRAAFVVRKQAEGVRVLDPAENIDHREAGRCGFDRLAPVDAPRGYDESVDPLAEQLIDVPPLARRIVGGVAYEDRDAVIGQAPLDRRDDREAEPAEAVGREDPDSHRARAMQALREVVRPVADRFGDAENLRARFGAEAAAGVERLGRGADRDAGEPRDVADGARRRAQGVVSDRASSTGRSFI